MRALAEGTYPVFQPACRSSVVNVLSSPKSGRNEEITWFQNYQAGFFRQSTSK